MPKVRYNSTIEYKKDASVRNSYKRRERIEPALQMFMTNDKEAIRDLDILEEIEANPDSTQATLAEKLGVAVGTVNWHVRRLVEKGFVEIQRGERRKLKYIITPEGIALRSKLVVNFIHSSMEMYRLIRSRMNTVLDTVEKTKDREVYIDGDGDIAEVCRLTCMERGFKTAEARHDDIPSVEIVGCKLFLHTKNEER